MAFSKPALQEQLKPFGKLKVEGNRFKVLLADGSTAARINFLNTLQDILPNAVIKNDNTNFSSVGYIQVDQFKIAGKPAKRQGAGSAGLKNENVFINSINKAIKDTGGSLDVCLIGGNNVKITIKQVSEAVEMGRQTSDYAKSDVDLIHENGIYKISLKQDNAEMWESADTRFGEMIRTKIDEAQKQGKVKLEPIMAAGGSVKKNQGKTVVKIVPESKVRMSLAEQKSVVFGNDIKEGKGAVVKKTFSTADFTYENDCLFIKCSKIYRNIQDVRTAGETPTILIRADSNRNSKKLGIAGLRIIVNVENNRTRRALDLT